jgi:hypothetical protein
MADDQTNPYVTMGMLGMMTPNKYIDPAYQNKSLPIPGFSGTPTDAQGNPIQSYLDWQTANPGGTTLNNTPAAPAASQPQLMGAGNFQKLAEQAQQTAAIDPTTGIAADPTALAQARYYRQMATSMQPQAVTGPAGSGRGYEQVGMMHPATSMYWQDPTGGVAAKNAQQSQGGGGIDMRQAYLNALSNPGKVTTPGANVPQSAPLGQPSVLDAFLSTHTAGPAAPAAGGYSNAPFFNTLNKLKGS